MTFLLRFSLIVVTCLSLSPIAVAAAPVAPSNCVAAGIANASGFGAKFVLNWKDNSKDEVRWRIDYKVNNGAYQNWAFADSGTTGATGGIISLPLDTSLKGILGLPGTTYSFKVFAINATQLSAASNETSVTPDLFSAKVSQVPNQVAVNLSWSAVQNASSFRIWSAPSGSSYSHIATAPGGATSAQVAAPAAGTKCYFVVEALLGSTTVCYMEVSRDVNVITSKTGTSGTPGSAFSHTFTQATVASVSSRSLTYNGQANLPAGLSFNSGSGVLSGVYPALGNYTLVYKATLSDSTYLTQSFSVRVRPAAGPPLVAAAIPAWNGVIGGSRDSDLAASFSDPEAESAVRVSTNLGAMDFILFDTATPATVANFKNYVNSGKYTGVAFHRSVSDFVIQGGGFKGTGTASYFNSVVTNSPVVNEPGIANIRGTISMAKLGGYPDSATSQFFVNTADNRSNLDYQNGGLTVFGRVAGNGMAVADAINDLPTNTYHLNVDGSSTTTAFDNFPMNASSAPASMDQSKLVKINSVTPIPTMVFSISGNTDPWVAAASVVGGQLHLEGLSGGHATITVTATDLDNLTTTQSVEVDLVDTYAAWASRNAFEGDQSGSLQNPDGDSLNNLLEYAFMEDPAVPSQSPLPVAGKFGDSPESEFMTLAFPVRNFTDGLSYVVEGTDAPGGAWSTVWSSADGFGHPQVIEAVDLLDRTEVKIQDTVAIGLLPKRFLRVRIVQE